MTRGLAIYFVAPMMVVLGFYGLWLAQSKSDWEDPKFLGGVLLGLLTIIMLLKWKIKRWKYRLKFIDQHVLKLNFKTYFPAVLAIFFIYRLFLSESFDNFIRTNTDLEAFLFSFSGLFFIGVGFMSWYEAYHKKEFFQQ